MHHLNRMGLGMMLASMFILGTMIYVHSAMRWVVVVCFVFFVTGWIGLLWERSDGKDKKKKNKNRS